MLRGAGACMILFSCGLISVKKVQSMKRKCRNVKELARGMFLLKHEIIFAGREMWEAIGAVAEGLSGEIGKLFEKVHSCLTQNAAVTLEHAWQETVPEDILPKDAVEYMATFTRKAGTFSEEQELQHLEQAEKMLTEIWQAEEKVLAKHKTLIYTAGLGGGCAIFILLL